MSQKFTNFTFTETVKIWVESRIIEAEQDTELTQQLDMIDYKERIERLAKELDDRTRRWMVLTMPRLAGSSSCQQTMKSPS